VSVSVIGGGNQSTRRKPPTCRKSLINFIKDCLPEKDYVTRGFARGWRRLTRGDNPSYHTLTRL